MPCLTRDCNEHHASACPPFFISFPPRCKLSSSILTERGEEKGRERKRAWVRERLLNKTIGKISKGHGAWSSPYEVWNTHTSTCRTTQTTGTGFQERQCREFRTRSTEYVPVRAPGVTAYPILGAVLLPPARHHYFMAQVRAVGGIPAPPLTRSLAPKAVYVQAGLRLHC